MKRSWLLAVIGAVAVASTLGFSAWYNTVQATIPAGSPNLQINTSLVCLVNSANTMDGWFTVTVTADTEATGIGSATAQLFITAKYIPHKADGSHLPETRQHLIVQSDTNTVDTGPVTAFVSGTGSVTVPAHEHTDHVDTIKIWDEVGSTAVHRATVPVASCEP